jgi:endonuclease/exonuclease/phosphatase family metal-dependent hydrolase
MCLNGWGGALHGELDRYLRDARPDVLCLQEVTRSPAATTGWLTYRDGDHVLPQRADLLRDVREALPGHAATFCPAAQGALWDGARAVPSLWGIATFVRAGLPVVAQAQGFVHGRFSPDGFGAHPPLAQRARLARLGPRAQGRPLTIAHMHGLRDPLRAKADTPERLAQARRFARLIEAVAEPGDPVVACGDLNVEPGSETFAVLAGLGLRDLVTASGADGTRTSHYAKPGRFADYMLVNDAVGVLAFEVVRAPEVSDHRPLLLTV